MIYSIWGPIASLKSSFPFSMPGFKYIFDLEQGAWRATRRIEDQSQFEIWDKNKILNVDKAKAGFLSKKRVVIQNQLETYEDLAEDFVDKCFDPNINIIVFDTAKQLWDIVCQAHLQSLQEDIEDHNKIQPKDAKAQRQQLTQIDYRIPNSRMTNFFSTAKSTNTDLVLINHTRPQRTAQYNKTKGEIESVETNKFELDGFKNTDKLCDVVLETGSDDNDSTKKKAWIRKSPFGPQLENQVLQVPIEEIIGFNYNTLVQTVNITLGNEVM